MNTQNAQNTQTTLAKEVITRLDQTNAFYERVIKAYCFECWVMEDYPVEPSDLTFFFDEIIPNENNFCKLQTLVEGEITWKMLIKIHDISVNLDTLDSVLDDVEEAFSKATTEEKTQIYDEYLKLKKKVATIDELTSKRGKKTITVNVLNELLDYFG